MANVSIPTAADATPIVIDLLNPLEGLLSLLLLASTTADGSGAPFSPPEAIIVGERE